MCSDLAVIANGIIPYVVLSIGQTAPFDCFKQNKKTASIRHYVAVFYLFKRYWHMIE